MIKAAKCWQQEATVGLVWQIKNRKQFLLCEFHGIKPVIKLVDQKPSALAPSGAFQALARKHLTGAILSAYFEIKNPATWALKWSYGSLSDVKNFWVIFTSDQGGQIELLDDQWISHIRWSKKGVFTHKKSQSADDYPWMQHLEKSQNRLDELLVLSKEKEPEDDLLLENSQNEESFLDIQKQAKRKITRRLRTVKKAFEKSKNALPSSHQIQQIQTKARLLKMYSYLIKKEMTALVLEPFQTGEETAVTISIDPDRSIGQNIDDLYVMAKKKEKALLLGQSRLLKEEEERKSLERSLKRLSEEKFSHDEVMGILSVHKLDLSPQQEKFESGSAIDLPYKVYKKEGLASFFVGRSSKENDLLTKSAASNDFWCHVVDGTGSHVIVPFKMIIQLDKNLEIIRRTAAILAIHFSKKRLDQKAEVYFTKKQHIKKKKGLPDGLWIVEKSDNFFVSYADDELKAILDNLLKP